MTLQPVAQLGDLVRVRLDHNQPQLTLASQFLDQPSGARAPDDGVARANARRVEDVAALGSPLVAGRARLLPSRAARLGRSLALPAR